MRLLKAVHRRTQTLERMFQRLRILCRARGLVRGGLRKVGDAAGLFVVCLGERADFGFQRAEQLEQFLFALVADGICAVNLRLNFADGVFDHSFWINITRHNGFGKIKWLALGVIQLLKVLRGQR
jgi:hypothetical protein